MDDTALLGRPLHGRGHRLVTLSQVFKTVQSSGDIGERSLSPRDFGGRSNPQNVERNPFKILFQLKLYSNGVLALKRYMLWMWWKQLDRQGGTLFP